MRIFRTEIWSYAVLLIILFCIAALAVWCTLQYIEEQVSTAEFHTITAAMWALTMGFMLIAGSFGLWAIQFAGEAEGRRRVGHFVDAMDYLSDGLLIMDQRGQIIGSNPAARAMSGSTLEQQESVGDVFRCLNAEDVTLLVDSDSPSEVERDSPEAGGMRIWRFRSQPAEGMVLVLVSDVTRANAQRIRSRQSARLQLIGEIAKGVAHDFNNLLCGISGYASLLSRMKPGSEDAGECTSAITKSVERGIAMAGHLLTLSQESAGGRFTDIVADHIESAGSILRDSLPDGWQVESHMHGRISPVSLTGTQVEQIVTNLGFLATDIADSPSILRIEAGGVDMPGILRTDSAIAGVLVIGVVPSGVSLNDFRPADKSGAEYGVIESVLKSMLLEAGGNLETVSDGKGHSMFRVSLPLGNMMAGLTKADALPDELKAYVSGWSVLLASPRREYAALEKSMSDLKMSVTTCDSIAGLLTAIEQQADVDAMVIDGRIVGMESKGILGAVLKLRPSAAIVVLCDDPDAMPRSMLSDISFIVASSAPDAVLAAMIEAKTLSSHRHSV